ncbi:unnamed protein product [Ceratitis capitata]|uniref:(Mediterranean fruit fly) hypothetical protein n=1 Tax=Ceratitis capitata TaxID=7213 RepID=A0A811UYB4_CERCA|nr:unnamed protein product [Ceratitis capitata]
MYPTTLSTHSILNYTNSYLRKCSPRSAKNNQEQLQSRKAYELRYRNLAVEVKFKKQMQLLLRIERKDIQYFLHLFILRSALLLFVCAVRILCRRSNDKKREIEMSKNENR